MLTSINTQQTRTSEPGRDNIKDQRGQKLFLSPGSPTHPPKESTRSTELKTTSRYQQPSWSSQPQSSWWSFLLLSTIFRRPQKQPRMLLPSAVAILARKAAAAAFTATFPTPFCSTLQSTVTYRTNPEIAESPMPGTVDHVLLTGTSKRPHAVPVDIQAGLALGVVGLALAWEREVRARHMVSVTLGTVSISFCQTRGTGCVNQREEKCSGPAAPCESDKG